MKLISIHEIPSKILNLQTDTESFHSLSLKLQYHFIAIWFPFGIRLFNFHNFFSLHFYCCCIFTFFYRIICYCLSIEYIVWMRLTKQMDRMHNKNIHWKRSRQTHTHTLNKFCSFYFLFSLLSSLSFLLLFLCLL